MWVVLGESRLAELEGVKQLDDTKQHHSIKDPQKKIIRQGIVDEILKFKT